MKTIMSRSSNESSFSFSRRNFKWVMKRGGDHKVEGEEEDQEEEETVVFNNAVSSTEEPGNGGKNNNVSGVQKRRGAVSAGRMLRNAFMAAVTAARVKNGRGGGGLGSKVTGTLFGQRRGHVHFAFQVDPKSPPVVLIELATPTSGLVREMASGLVRIALECEKKDKKEPTTGAGSGGGGAVKLLEEPLWRTYCNGKKCGYAVRRECGPNDLTVLRAVEPVSMGAGVIPIGKTKDSIGIDGSDGEMMYMRARFERVVGSKDSEAFYMMNPDSNGGPELSIYLLRV